MTESGLGLMQGMKSVPEALAILSRRPKILLWLVPPLLITLLLDGIVFFLAFGWIRDGIRGFVSSHGNANWLTSTMSVFAAIAVVLLLGWSFVWLFLALASPFQDFISAAVERERTGAAAQEPAGWTGFAKGAGRGVLQALVLMMISVPMLVIGFIPVIGPVLVFVWSAFAMGFSFSTIPAGRVAGRLRDRLKFARGNRGAVFGLGAVIALVALIPLASLLFMPVFVVAGTLVHLKAAENRRDPRIDPPSAG